MVYGDLQFIDIIIFAGIAAFLIYRLRNVLGKRGGYENKQNTNIEKSDQKTTNENKLPPQLKENEQKLSTVYENIPNFDHKNFLGGAKYAFETIINAFNQNDKKTLKGLLTKDVYASFEQAIDSKNNNPGFQFYSLTIDGVEDVTVGNGLINITLNITSEQFKDEDENTVIKKQDTWTFQKAIKSKSTIWLLSST
ncbi:Tim44/TimA family putative adaptor protein [Alphaproteobacteria bacterium]|nr:Tim44/TimA family putative adaptor protein [Alphaproteobacteria bacterium]